MNEIDEKREEMIPGLGALQTTYEGEVPKAEGQGVDGAIEKTGASALTSEKLSEEEIARMTADIIAAIKTVYDPEIPVDIYELGLIYKIDIEDNRSVHVEMTLTAPGCPVAGEMPQWVVDAVVGVPGVQKAKVTLTFDPPWDMGKMSDEARLALNLF